VYPLAVAVAEQFSGKTQFNAPDIESTGTGGGMKSFCAGVGPQFPDIANASRQIKKSEVEVCGRNGVKEIIEVQIGYDGIVLAGSKEMPTLNVSRKDLYNALSLRIPDPGGQEKLINNPHKTWKDVNPALPDLPIAVIGPPQSSGTRDALRELVMEPVCEESALVKELKESSVVAYAGACLSFRRDGAYTEGSENDEEIFAALTDKPNSVVIFGYGTLQAHADQLQAMPIDGVEPTFEKIAAGNYPLSRPLFLYVKQAHWDVIPGLKEYLAEFTAEQAWGPEGYLAAKGLIPLAKEARGENKAKLDRQERLVAN
jgi:phosphate transport system substrate-binding protein